jgi:predicted nucleic acid-binding Zn ribbon protein
VQSFSDPALTECPACQGRLRKVFNSVGVVFKGSGFYRTDSRAGNNGAESTKADAKAETKTDAKSETKTAAKSDSSSNGSSGNSTSGTTGSSSSNGAAKTGATAASSTAAKS